jgi:hypothetical protein
LQAFICASDKTDGTTTADVEKIKFAVPYTVDVLVDKARMNEIKNKQVLSTILLMLDVITS